MKNAFKDYNKEHMARAVGVALPISFKQSYEICNFLRNKPVTKMKKYLQDVVDKKKAIPFRRYDFDLSHKTKMGPGRFPVKASMELIQLIESAESNAQFKGLNTSNLTIVHISAHKAGKSWRYGRHSRRKAKRTHIELVLQENKQDVKTAKSKSQKAEAKAEVKHGALPAKEAKHETKQEAKHDTKEAKHEHKEAKKE